MLNRLPRFGAKSEEPPGLSVLVNEEKARALAQRLLALRPKAAHFMPRPLTPQGRLRLVNCYLAWVGICQQTRTLKGRVNGVAYRGSDYLAHRFVARCDASPESFDAASLAVLTPTQLKSWLSDDGDPDHSTCDRVEERVAQLRDLGTRLLDGFNGDGTTLLASSKARLKGKRGLLQRLSHFSAYRDPVQKKSFLLIHFLRGLGILEPVDPESLGLPVDYHLLRIFLRSGALELRGARSADLTSGGTPSQAEDLALRHAGVAIGATMAQVLPLGQLDGLLWMIGRNCCSLPGLPVCQKGESCTKAPNCSLRISVDPEAPQPGETSAQEYECGLECPLAGACDGSRNLAQAELVEPNYQGPWY